ncbi:Cof-type HAD-IIB family hydrolase [Paenibacillus validus]|uniref:Cof-type HAD-IIB family hydrolase n=1 Tax=Paenibacillus TaxID=44249 RepID=UPI0006CF6130|nr:MULTISPECIES: Cof-type HAD-IIB family hydrolase [Paenibacillus]MED4599841.1 Cof-type HAD-IIB family hydrolase [Paenibacillus validus]MED4606553.1 Cof-type HAD-IIB family hydrolase [Paenibacillus validus]
MIRLVAFDVDGTLRDRDQLPESTRTALKQLKERGIALALCTGRSEYEMASLREELGIDWAITCNGSHVGHRGKTLSGTPFARTTVEGWLTEAERLNHTLLLYGANGLYTNRENAPLFRRAQQEIGFMEPTLIDSASGELPEIYQSIIFCGEEEESFYTGAERDGFYVHRWRTWAVDLNPSGMNKAIGLRMLMDHLAIAPEETAAFGDGLNDLEMIASVGMGIAMGNACEELKERARFVTKPLHEDGIAYAVEKWILPA